MEIINHKSLSEPLPRDICRDEFSLAVRGKCWKFYPHTCLSHLVETRWKINGHINAWNLCVLARQRHSALCDRFPSSLYLPGWKMSGRGFFWGGRLESERERNTQQLMMSKLFPRKTRRTKVETKRRAQKNLHGATREMD